MTNDLDRLLEQVVDALEDSQAGLWLPDLTAPVLPAVEGEKNQTTRDDSPAEGRSQAWIQNGNPIQRYGDALLSLPTFSALEDGLPARISGKDLPTRILEKKLSAQIPEKKLPVQTSIEAESEALPRFERAWDVEQLMSEQSSGGTQESQGAVVLQSSSPALLEQLQTLEAAQASAEAFGRSLTASSGLSSRSLAEQGGGGVQYDPAALGDSPLAAAAAAAQDEDRARAVDRAFQRDSRRYDRGFSLY